MLEINLVAEILARFGGCAKGVHGGRHDGRGGLLVVEDGESGGN